MPKKWKSKAEYNAYMRNYNRRIRQELIKKLGGKCENCGNQNMEVLSINGSRKKKILCHNCRESMKIKVEKKTIKN